MSISTATARNRSGIIAIVVTLTLILGLLSGCASTTPASTPTPTPAQDTSITVTDMNGREITLPAPAVRIVAVSPADCEIVAALAPDVLVGRGTYCNWPEEILDVPVITSGSGLSAEQIVALEPDLVIMSSMNHTTEQVELLERAGLIVVTTASGDIAGVYTAIKLIGDVLGESENAEGMTSFMTTYFQYIVDKVSEKDLNGANVYFEVSPLEYGLWAAGKGTFMDEIAMILGLENAFADIERWKGVSQEQVIERDPDYIITSTMYSGEGPLPEEEIMAREGWGDMSAVVNGTVFHAKDDEITRPGPRLMLATSVLYTLIYGEDISPADVGTVDGVAYIDGVFTFSAE